MTTADEQGHPVPVVGHVSLSEAARLLGCSKSLLAHGIPRGRFAVLAPFKGVNGRWRVPVAAIAQHQAERQRTAYGRPLARIRRSA